jgi:hypothetical protein
VLDSNTVPLLAALEPTIVQTAEEIKGLKDSQDMLKKNHNSLVEQSNVLLLGKEIYQTHASLQPAGQDGATALDRMASVELMSLSEFGAGTSSMLKQVAGMINREHTASLERVIFRATRGNAVFRSIPAPAPLLDPNAKGGGEFVDKDFFMVFFAGEVLKDKISKISSYFGASLYKFPETTAEHNEMTDEVARRIDESQEVMDRGSEVMRELLVGVGVSYPTWSYVCAKEKMSYDALNMCATEPEAARAPSHRASPTRPPHTCGQDTHVAHAHRVPQHPRTPPPTRPPPLLQVRVRHQAARLHRGDVGAQGPLRRGGGGAAHNGARERPGHAADHEQDQDHTDAADAHPGDQLLARLPGARQHVRHAALPRVQPGRVLLYHVPLPLRHHVR